MPPSPPILATQGVRTARIDTSSSPRHVELTGVRVMNSVTLTASRPEVPPADVRCPRDRAKCSAADSDHSPQVAKLLSDPTL